MDPLDKVVAGLSCREVLAHLGDFLDGDLVPAVVVQVQGHLAGCDTCERFGGHVGGLVGQLRALATAEAPVPPGVAERLARRLGAGAPSS